MSRTYFTGNKDIDRLILLKLKGDDLVNVLDTPVLKDICDNEFWKLKLDQD